MHDDNSQPPVTTLDRSARQWGLREWGFLWDEAGAVSTSSHPTAIRGVPLPFGWRFAQKYCVLEMHAIFTSEPGAGRCAHYITRRGAAAPNYVLEYMYWMCINWIH
ncbi:hypothetical protein DFH08DRAFT_818369 [Mycena albidolilacea]|uniref:Uncharacterized protein n=1 Tax=Mycena albidolilacea TaxID=1033008 RepID=A0AAD6ZHA9_9AGAR|nr:hypothetical protein DFH08DRAFT_818369 [Mycena albidolilacea]